MARYRAADTSERRTAFIGIQLTPSERTDLESAAAGVPLSTYARAMLFSRSADAVANRRNPEAAGLMRELNAIGNNLEPDRAAPAYDRRRPGRLGRAAAGAGMVEAGDQQGA